MRFVKGWANYIRSWHMFYNMKNTYVLTHFINASSMGLFYAIHGNHMSTLHAHPWEPRMSMSMRTLCHTIMCKPFRLILSSLGRDYEHLTTISDVHKIYTIKYSRVYIFSLTFMLFCVWLYNIFVLQVTRALHAKWS